MKAPQIPPLFLKNIYLKKYNLKSSTPSPLFNYLLEKKIRKNIYFHIFLTPSKTRKEKKSNLEIKSHSKLSRTYFASLYFDGSPLCEPLFPTSRDI